MRQPLALPAGRVALLLVDLQEEHRHVPHYLVPDYDRVLANAARLLAARLRVVRAAAAGVARARRRRGLQRQGRPADRALPGGGAAAGRAGDPEE